MVFENVSGLVSELFLCEKQQDFFSKYGLASRNKYFKGENSSIEDITLQPNSFTKTSRSQSIFSILDGIAVSVLVLKTLSIVWSSAIKSCNSFMCPSSA